MTDNFYITLSSDGSSVFTRNNKPSDFKIHLLENLNLHQGQWKVGISSFQCNSAIDNLSTEEISIWDGDKLSNITFAPTCCKSMKHLIQMINQRLKPLDVFPRDILREHQKAHPKDTRSLNSLAVPRLDLKGELYKELMTQFELTKPPPHRDGEAGYPLTQNNTHFELIASHPEFAPDRENKKRKRRALETDRDQAFIDEEALQEEDLLDLSQYDFETLIKPSSRELRETTPEDSATDNVIHESAMKAATPSRDLTERIKDAEQTERTTTLEKAFKVKLDTLQHANEAFSTIAELNLPAVLPYPTIAQVPETSYELNFAADPYDNVSVNCRKPDFDIGFSNSLLNILGFGNEFQMQQYSFKKRMFFRAYLQHYAKNMFYLKGAYFEILHRAHMIADKSHLNYWHFMNNVIGKLLQINGSRVWLDFNFEKSAEEQLTNGKLWPINTKFNDFFGAEFRDFVKEIETLLNDNVFTDPIIPFIPAPPLPYRALIMEEKFRYRGVIIAYFMLKTLWEEQPLGKNITTVVPPDLHYATDTLLIYSDIVEENLVNETSMALLRQFKLPQTFENEENRNVQASFNPIQYKNCIKTSNLSTIRIYISSIVGTPIQFLRGPIFIVLHFIQEALK
jgi:hypothetical protein